MEDNVTTTVKTDTIDYKAEYEKMQSEYAKLKSNFDKASSEIAEHKRKDKERMTDEQKRQAEFEEREARYKAIEKENSLYKFKSNLSKHIKDETILNEVAECYANGDIEAAIQKQNDYYTKSRSELEKSLRTELLQKNPQPTPQSDKGKMTKEQIMAIPDFVERQQAIAQNIDLFK